MKRSLIIAISTLLAATAASIPAMAKTYISTIDHNTPGVIASESLKARLVLTPAGDCKHIPYDVIADGVKSLSGELDLSAPRSMPLDFTTVTLSCSPSGVKAEVNVSKSALENLGL